MHVLKNALRHESDVIFPQYSSDIMLGLGDSALNFFLLWVGNGGFSGGALERWVI